MKVYLETSVPNFLFADDAPPERDVTRAFWQWLKLSHAEAFVSQVGLDEIAAAPAPKRERLLAALDELDYHVLAVTPQVVGLAERLVRDGIVPPRYADDARHVATAVVNEIDVLASWNLEHIVKLKTMAAAYGFRPPRILTPQEILP